MLNWIVLITIKNEKRTSMHEMNLFAFFPPQAICLYSADEPKNEKRK